MADDVDVAGLAGYPPEFHAAVRCMCGLIDGRSDRAWAARLFRAALEEAFSDLPEGERPEVWAS